MSQFTAIQIDGPVTRLGAPGCGTVWYAEINADGSVRRMTPAPTPTAPTDPELIRQAVTCAHQGQAARHAHQLNRDADLTFSIL